MNRKLSNLAVTVVAIVGLLGVGIEPALASDVSPETGFGAGFSIGSSGIKIDADGNLITPVDTVTITPVVEVSAYEEPAVEVVVPPTVVKPAVVKPVVKPAAKVVKPAVKTAPVKIVKKAVKPEAKPVAKMPFKQLAKKK